MAKESKVNQLLKCVEVLPDGTRVLENGFKIAPSKVCFGDGEKTVLLDKMPLEQREQWENNLMARVGRAMSGFYQSMGV